MPKILIADDHALMRRGMRTVLEAEGWEVCGEATTGRDAVDMVIRKKPDVAIVDISLPELNGFEVTRQIIEKAPETEVLIFTMHEGEELMREILASGARGCVLKTDLEGNLVVAVRALLQHSVYFSPKAASNVKEILQGSDRTRTTKPSIVELTEREREIVQLLAQAKSNKEVSTALSISVRTVETHRAAIMRKLEINSVVELVHYAIRNK